MVNLLELVPSKVYFPKLVAIENKRLYALQMAANLGVFLLVIVIFMVNPIPQIVEPETRMNLWTSDLRASTTGLDESIICADPSQYDYSFGDSSAWMMANTSCAHWCSGYPNIASGDPACVHEAEMSESWNEEVFVATAFTEELHLMTDACPFAEDDEGECRRTRGYILPHAEQFAAKMMLEYQIEVPDSFYHKYMGLKHIPTLDLLVVVRGPDKAKRATPLKVFRQGEVFVLTIAEAFQAAGFDAAGLDAEAPSSRAEEFPDSLGAGHARPRVRITGMDVELFMEFVDNIRDDNLGIKKGDTVCMVDVEVSQTWNSRQVFEYLDEYGSIRSRTYTGIRFHIYKQGEFQYEQVYKLLYTATLSVAWLRVPFFLVFYFAVFLLGTLSDVYSGFLYHELDFHKEFAGVSSRMLKTSFSFNDLHDIKEEEGFTAQREQVLGISKDRATQRMEMIFEGTPLGGDKAKMDIFTNFFFQHGALNTRMPSGVEAMRLENFMNIFGSKEDLLWTDIVEIFNSEATQNTLEKIFMDATLQVFYKEDKRIGHQKKDYKIDKRVLEADVNANKQAFAMQLLQKRRSLYHMAKQPNLVRAMYGQEFLAEHMQKLDLALKLLKKRYKHTVFNANSAGAGGQTSTATSTPGSSQPWAGRGSSQAVAI